MQTQLWAEYENVRLFLISIKRQSTGSGTDVLDFAAEGARLVQRRHAAPCKRSRLSGFIGWYISKAFGQSQRHRFLEKAMELVLSTRFCPFRDFIDAFKGWQ